MTVEELTAKIGIGTRYLYRIENERKKPSHDVLCKLVWELSIPGDEIFYQDKPGDDSEIATILRMLATCDERLLDTAKAMLRALLDHYPKD